jgi:hypothetical protein
MLALDPTSAGAEHQHSVLLEGSASDLSDTRPLLYEALDEGIFLAEVFEDGGPELRVSRLIERLDEPKNERAPFPTGSPPLRGDSYLCGVCGHINWTSALHCPECGSGGLARARNGYLIEFPRGTLPCPGCGAFDQPVRFRTWSRLMAFLFWVWDERRAAYVCPACNRREATLALLFTALLGWWSIPSWFFHGWRSTYVNWRAVWAAPASAGEWGAVPIEDLAYDIRAHVHESYVDDVEEELHGTPLAELDPSELQLISRVEGLYEVLGVGRDADLDEIRTAYRARAKAHHPDLRGGDPQANAEMILINQAREVLLDPRLRAAYNWIEERRPVGA